MATLKKFKKIPIYVVEEHNDALQFIYSAIGGKKLPLEGTTLLHLDAHPDMLIDRKLKGEEARSGRHVLPLLQIENWIVPAAAAGHIGRVVWLRPPWASQFRDDTRPIHVGDHPTSGELRVDCKEPYYLSDALYSPQLVNKRKFIFTSAELSDSSFSTDESKQNFITNINVEHPYVLAILIWISSALETLFSVYTKTSMFTIDCNRYLNSNFLTSTKRTRLIKLSQRGSDNWENSRTCSSTWSSMIAWITMRVDELATAVLAEASRLNEKPDWWAVFAGGCTRDQGGLPYHISTEQEIEDLVKKALVPLLKNIPPPVLITIARSSDDGYCPPHQVDHIQSLVLDALKEIFDTDDPALYYLSVNT
ncbi:hypothetical protein SFRURICE_021601 [Spodoptera frugiperda]|nr:hypothetical protein SFRURICE_021601 [Spodoptera frugiperda]